MDAFKGYKGWYKGNLHTHTTKSDGRYTPEETVDIYKKHGYDFLVLTDHRVYNRKTYGDKLLIIPGTEQDAQFTKFGWATHHAVSFDDGRSTIEDDVRFESFKGKDSEEAGQKMFDYMKEHNCYSIYCHPVWSRVELEDILPLKGFFAMEVYNSASYFEGNVGTITAYWDSILRRGMKVWGVAADDSHILEHCCRGWVMVNAPECSVKAITENLLCGNFYASSGPELYNFTIEDGTACVKCSECRAVHFVSWNRPGHSVVPGDGKLITSAEWEIGKDQNAQYIRVELEDKEGRFAWSNPIFLDGRK